MVRLFLTGSPGVGKTTLIRVVIARLEEVTCAGFYTEEKRQRGQRVGFRIVTLSGREGTLASVGRKEPTLGRYSIHVEEFERRALPDLDPGTTPAELYVIDRIGDDKILFASDYPHWDGMFPYVVSTIHGRKDISEESKGKFLGENAKKLYGWE